MFDYGGRRNTANAKFTSGECAMLTESTGGQANVRRWSDDILPLLTDDSDPLGTETFATHRLPLTDAPEAYAKFRDKEDGMIKVVFKP